MPGIHLVSDKWFINQFFIKQAKRAGAHIFYAVEGQTSIEVASPSFILPMDVRRNSYPFKTWVVDSELCEFGFARVNSTVRPLTWMVFLIDGTRMLGKGTQEPTQN